MSIEQTREVMHVYWDGREEEVIAEDAVFTMMSTGVESRGREAILEAVYNFYSIEFEGYFQPEKSIVADGSAVLEGFLVGKQVRTFAGIEPTGKELRVPMCIVYDVEDGMVQGARIYFETAVLGD